MLHFGVVAVFGNITWPYRRGAQRAGSSGSFRGALTRTMLAASCGWWPTARRIRHCRRARSGQRVCGTLNTDRHLGRQQRGV